jgi:hypothetical protein
MAIKAAVSGIVMSLTKRKRFILDNDRLPKRPTRFSGVSQRVSSLLYAHLAHSHICMQRGLQRYLCCSIINQAHVSSRLARRVRKICCMRSLRKPWTQRARAGMHHPLPSCHPPPWTCQSAGEGSSPALDHALHTLMLVEQCSCSRAPPDLGFNVLQSLPIALCRV